MSCLRPSSSSSSAISIWRSVLNPAPSGIGFQSDYKGLWTSTSAPSALTGHGAGPPARPVSSVRGDFSVVGSDRPWSTDRSDRRGADRRAVAARCEVRSDRLYLLDLPREVERRNLIGPVNWGTQLGWSNVKESFKLCWFVRSNGH